MNYLREDRAPIVPGVASRRESRTYVLHSRLYRLEVGPCLKEPLCGGEAGECRPLHLRSRVGVTAEDEGWRDLDVDERLLVGLRDPAVLPAVDRDGLRLCPYIALRFFEEQAGDGGVFAPRVLAAPPGAGVDGDGRDLGDALLAVVGDPEEGVALDLDPARFGHAAGAVEERHHRDAGIVADAF